MDSCCLGQDDKEMLRSYGPIFNTFKAIDTLKKLSRDFKIFRHKNFSLDNLQINDGFLLSRTRRERNVKVVWPYL